MRKLTSMGVSTLALALALCCSARADASPPEPDSSAPGSPAAQAPEQAQVAAATRELDKALSDQFVKGQIDPNALAPLVNDVVHAMSEAIRPQVEAQIARVLEAAQRLASEMTPEQRAQMVGAPVGSNPGNPLCSPYLGCIHAPSGRSSTEPPPPPRTM